MQFTLAFRSRAPSTFTTANKIAAKGIQVWTKSEYYHVELVIAGYWMSSRVEDGGTKLIPLRKPLLDSYDYYTIDVDGLTGKRVSEILKFIKKQEKTRYDWLAIFRTQFVKLGLGSQKKWLCSEIVTKVLQLLFVEEVLDLSPERMSPGKLYKLLEHRLEKVKVN